MNCEEMHQALAEVLEGAPSSQAQAHLAGCAECSALVEEVNLIITTARTLPEEEPSPRVWESIMAAAKAEGLVRETGPARALPFLPGFGMRWGYAAAAAVVLFAVVITVTQHTQKPAPQMLAGKSDVAAQPVAIDDDDMKLLDQVQSRSPEMRKTYERDLRNVNRYIADAKKYQAQNPDDEDARAQLMNAYNQKAALYQMASFRTVQYGGR